MPSCLELIQKCIAERNTITFQKSPEIAGTEEATKLRSEAMKNPTRKAEKNSVKAKTSPTTNRLEDKRATKEI